MGRRGGHLGQAYQELGNAAEALECLERASALHREMRDASMELLDLHHPGLVLGSMGRIDASPRSLRQALSIHHWLGLPDAAGSGALLSGPSTVEDSVAR